MTGRFLDWFERHKFGVVGTLMLHTFMLFALAMSKLPVQNEAEAPPEMVMEMAAPVEAPPDPMLQPPMLAPVEVSNQVSNALGERQPPMRLYPGEAAQERMAEASAEELAAEEAAWFDSLARKRKAEGKEIEMPVLDSSKWKKERYMPKEQKAVKVEGLTTVEYVFEGAQRAAHVLHVPAYLCTGQGKVVIRIEVDARGALRKAELDEGATDTMNECMRDHAIASARGASFSSGSASQRGTITYIFLAQ